MEDCKCHCHNGATCCSECYKKHKEPPYVIGDRLEITITGTVVTGNNGDTLNLVLDDSSVSMYLSGYSGEVTGWAAASKIKLLPPPEPQGTGAVVQLKKVLFTKAGGKWFRDDGCMFSWAQLVKDGGEIFVLREGINRLEKNGRD